MKQKKELNEELLEVCIEIPRKSNVKYEVDQQQNHVKVDRILHNLFHYPENYGFIPNSLDYDGDPLDILLIGDYSIAPLAKVNVRVIGVLLFDDEGLIDNKIICILPTDPVFGKITDIKQIDESRQNTISYFFKHYKDNEKKQVIVKGFQSREKAQKIVSESLNLFHSLRHKLNELSKTELVKILVKLQNQTH